MELAVTVRLRADESVMHGFHMGEVVSDHILRISRRIRAGSMATLITAGLRWIVDIEVVPTALLAAFPAF